MTKKEFLAALRRKLRAVPQAELRERLGFYSEIIDDKMEEGLTEGEAVADVGNVDEIAEQIRSAGRIIEQAITIEDVASKKALQNAAKVLIDNAMARFDESIGTSIADDEDE